MTTDTEAARLQRKRQLIAEGAVYRAGLALARRQAESEWQSRSAALRTAGAAGRTALRLLGNGAVLQAIVPLLSGGLTALARKTRLGRLAANTAIAAGVAAAVRLLLRKKRS
jgi:hypothetical protein